jgi:hypothetical protein
MVLVASRWRVRPQRLEGEEDDMTRMVEEDLEDRVGGRPQLRPQDTEYIGGTSTNIKIWRKRPSNK